MKCAAYLIDYSSSCYSRLDNEEIYQVTALFIGKLHTYFNLSYSDPPVFQPHATIDLFLILFLKL